MRATLAGRMTMAVISVGSMACGFGTAEAAPNPTAAFYATGDVRLRLEEDWDSKTASGSRRPDRGRARIRVRLRGTARVADKLTLGAGLRTGNEGSQQNANVTFLDFNGNRRDPGALALDSYYARFSFGRLTGTAGRFDLPFFTQNEYFWDGDIKPLGAALGINLAQKNAVKISITGGAFRLPVGLSKFFGSLYAGQLVATRISKREKLDVAAGLFAFRADADNSIAAHLLENNGTCDYDILAVSIRHISQLGLTPLVIGGDFFRNLKSYENSTDPLTRAHAGERTGYVLSISFGDASEVGHLQIGYRLSSIELLAVNNSYAHDDLARFGTATQSRLSGISGHDIYANYGLSDRLMLGARAMFVKNLTTSENGKRARLDLVYSF